MVQIQANWNEIDSWSELEPIPAGEYAAKIIGQENQNTKSGSTQLVMSFEIIEGAYAGRKIFERLSLWAEPDKGKNIALARIKKMAEVTASQRGQQAFSDTNEFNGVPMNIKVDVQPPKDGYKASNKIADFMPYRSTAVPDTWNGGQPAAAPQPAPVAQPAPTPAPTTSNGEQPTSAPATAPAQQPQPVAAGGVPEKAPWE